MLWSFLCLVLVVVSAGSADIDGPGVYQVTDPIGHAEGPHWDPRKNILYFVNIFKGEVYAYHYTSKLLKKITLNGSVSPVVPSKKNADLLLVGLNRSVVAVEWDGKNTLGDQQILTTVSADFPKSRFNDGKADKQGRLWWGTIGEEVNLVVASDQAYFYTITRSNLANPTVARFPVSNSNGLAWNKANDKLFYIDTSTFKVVEFEYYADNGTISDTNRTTFDLKKHADVITGFPDGMTIDTEDNLYIALYSGGSVIKVNPTTGEILKIIPIPSRDVTSVMWGGPNLDILFVTTSNASLNDEQRLQYPAAGSVFAVKGLNAKGYPANNADIIDAIRKKNFLDMILGSDLLPRESTVQKIVQPRRQVGVWETLINTFRTLFP